MMQGKFGNRQNIDMTQADMLCSVMEECTKKIKGDISSLRFELNNTSKRLRNLAYISAKAEKNAGFASRNNWPSHIQDSYRDSATSAYHRLTEAQERVSEIKKKILPEKYAELMELELSQACTSGKIAILKSDILSLSIELDDTRKLLQELELRHDQSIDELVDSEDRVSLEMRHYDRVELYSALSEAREKVSTIEKTLPDKYMVLQYLEFLQAYNIELGIEKPIEVPNLQPKRVATPGGGRLLRTDEILDEAFEQHIKDVENTI